MSSLGASGQIGPGSRPPMSTELYAAGRVIGNKCFDQNFDYMQCKAKDGSPTACAAEGEAVHQCVYGLYKEISAKAPTQFTALATCLDKNDLRSYECKPQQQAFEKVFYAA